MPSSGSRPSENTRPFRNRFHPRGDRRSWRSVSPVWPFPAVFSAIPFSPRLTLLPPPYSPIPLLGHKITGQALLALTLVFGGGGLTLVGLRGWFWTAGRFLLFALAAFVAFAYLFIHPLLLVATYRG